MVCRDLKLDLVQPFNSSLAQLMLKYKTEGLPINLHKRAPQSGILVALLGSLQNTVSSLGKVWPQSQVPAIQTSPSDRLPEARKRKIRYGPYRIPATSEKNIEYHLLQAKGMTNTMKFAAPKPCDRNCMMVPVVVTWKFSSSQAMNAAKFDSFSPTRASSRLIMFEARTAFS